MTWSRRDVLGALGAGAASALAWGCGGTMRASASARVAELDPRGLRERLRNAIAQLGAAFPEASGLLSVHTRTVATADEGGRSSRREITAALVLVGRDAAGRQFERVTDDLSDDGVRAAVDALAGGRRGAHGATSFGAPSDAWATALIDPADAVEAVWLERAGSLLARSGDAGSSRIVYRGAYLDVDDASVWFVGPGRDAHQRLVKTRAGVTLVAWSGSRPITATAEVAAAAGLEIADVPKDAIDHAAERVLELMTPTAGPRGESLVVLEPRVVAAIVDAGVVGMMTASAWERRDTVGRRGPAGGQVGSALLSIVDDPATKGAYGGYAFDDEGVAAASMTLIDHGVLGAPIVDRGTAATLAQAASGHGRRAGFVGPIAAASAHVAVAPGSIGVDALVAGAGDGLLAEGAGVARVDPVSWELVMPIDRARVLRGGRRTGQVHADLELRATVPALLGAISGVSSEVQPVAWRDELDGGARWRSASAPWLVTRATIAPRRGGS